MLKKNPFGDPKICVLIALCATLGSGLAVADEPTQPVAPAASATTPADGDTTLQQVVVTAETYASTAQSTPISISAVTGAQLEARGITSLEEVARDVPGLSMRSAGPDQTEFEARGIASNGGNSPTVGFYLGDIPLSPPAMGQIGKVVIDPDLYDLDRVEVLRGPQGTLYGASSMGGTIKLIPNQPLVNNISGSTDATLSHTDGGRANGSADGMFNYSNSDYWAVRGVLSDDYRSGWISRTVLNPFPADVLGPDGPPYTRGNVLDAPVQKLIPDVNREQELSGRLEVLIQPNDKLHINLLALGQLTKLGGYDEFDLPPGDAYETHYQPYPLAEEVHDRVSVFSATVVANLPFADLTSATGYFDRRSWQIQDASEATSWTLESFLVSPQEMAALGMPTYIDTPIYEAEPEHQISEELRLNSTGSDTLHWATGLFYSSLNSAFVEQQNAPYIAQLSQTLSPPMNNPTGLTFGIDNLYEITQKAVFADASWQFVPTFKVEGGLRWFRYDTSAFNNEWGYFFTPQAAPLANPPGNFASASGVIPRADVAWMPNNKLTTYVSVSKGFRPGGANMTIPPVACPLGGPESFDSDTVWDYEAGEKAMLDDSRIRLNADVYYIKWDKVQQTALLSCGTEYTTNAGDGRSYGPELDFAAKITEAWTFYLSGAYTRADITSVNPAYEASLGNAGYSFPGCTIGGSCSSVPILNVPKEEGSAALEYGRPVGDLTLTARLDATYTGSSWDEAYSVIQLPGYAMANFRIGLAADRWTGSLFVTNLTNKVPWVSANNTSFSFNIGPLTRISTLQPMTIGTQWTYKFQ
ncbi:MAG TPA: TonB-dependent receptor [Steroidobacteraceae bacterium]|nr:TonB-dependent receptor [Steroidobacteraceae bacterium]